MHKAAILFTTLRIVGNLYSLTCIEEPQIKKFLCIGVLSLSVAAFTIPVALERTLRRMSSHGEPTSHQFIQKPARLCQDFLQANVKQTAGLDVFKRPKKRASTCCGVKRTDTMSISDRSRTDVFSQP